MLHPITIRVDSTTFSTLSSVAKTRGVPVAEIVRQRLADASSETTNLLALIAGEIDEQRVVVEEQKETLAAILAALENIAAPALPTRAQSASPAVGVDVPKAAVGAAVPAPQKAGTGEQWGAWISRQEFAPEDAGSPAARGRRLWQKFEAETGNEAPAQFRAAR